MGSMLEAGTFRLRMQTRCSPGLVSRHSKSEPIRSHSAPPGEQNSNPPTVMLGLSALAQACERDVGGSTRGFPHALSAAKLTASHNHDLERTMPAPVFDRPPVTQVASHVVNRPVSARHGGGWQDTLHFLLGYNMPPIVSTTIEKQPSGTSADYVFAYRRTPGARALAVMVQLHEVDDGVRECTVEASVLGATTAYLPSASPEGNLRGSAKLAPPIGYWAAPKQFVDVIDVSALTVGTLYWVRVRWTDSVTLPGTKGISYLNVFEVPRATLADDTSDAGIDGGWPFAGNDLDDGTSSTLSGFERLTAEIDRARSQMRRHHQLVTIENTTDAWALGASVGTWAPVLFGRSSQPTFSMRARRLYASGTENVHQLVCRYTTQHASNGAQLRITATSRTTGTVRTATLTLPASTTFVASGTVAALIPCDGVDQEVAYSFEFQTSGAANLKLSAVDLIENEP